MPAESPAIIDYYQHAYNEHTRFTQDKAHSVEFLTTMRLLTKHLPPGCRVLDCCAASGAYAFPLAKAGYRVTAGDLTPAHVDMLKEGNKDGLLEHIYEGNVLSMPFADESFDAVLCMGALYHLATAEERVRCLAECLRVLKAGGVFVFVYINRFAQFVTIFNGGGFSPEDLRLLRETGWAGIFYSMDFGEADALVKGFPIEKIAEAGVDGPMYLLMERLNASSDGEFDAFMDYHLETCEQPSVLGQSIHGLWIGRKAVKAGR
jgi:SAM-dependent methyltransferase